MSAQPNLPLSNTQWQKYDSYDVPVDNKQGDRATSIKWFSLKRPHMRTFYVSTFGYFVAFLAWFAFAPLMPEVEKTLGLTKSEVYNANIAAVAATVAGRFAVGPLCDTYGPRLTFSALLVVGSIPSFFSGLVQSATDLAIVRFFIGLLGACFVCNQVWTSQIFAKQIVGLASATSAGFGNVGGGITQLFMVLLFAALKTGMSSETAWRVSFIIPSTLVLLSAIVVLTLADDCPKGNFKELIAAGSMVRKSSKKSAAMGYRNPNSWILAMQYAASLGMELTITNTAATYFFDKYALSTTTAGLIATLFGFMNIFSRSLGGQLSDIMYRVYGGGTLGLRGRFIAHFCCLVLEGVMLIIFSRMDTLAGSVILLVVFALGVQMSNGTNFSIVPYVCPEATGAVSGVVGAGGNMGAILWGLLFRFGPAKEETCFLYLGYIVLALACITPLIDIKGYRSCFRRAHGEPAAIDVI